MPPLCPLIRRLRLHRLFQGKKEGTDDIRDTMQTLRASTHSEQKGASNG